MTRVTAEEAVKAALSQLTELTEICDASGQILGYFAPASLQHAAGYAEGAGHFDPAEIKRRKAQQQPGHTTQEVLDRLKSMEKA